MKTSYYSRLNKIDKSQYEPIAISGDEGKLVGFEGKGCRKLSPYPFYRKWKKIEDEIEDNYKTGQITLEEYSRQKEENQQSYIEKFYNIVLKPLDPREIYKELGSNSVLLCFEKPTEFCHRFLVAGWFELNLGLEINELGFENDKKVLKNKQNLKEKLKKVIEKDKLEERTEDYDR